MIRCCSSGENGIELVGGPLLAPPQDPKTIPNVTAARAIVLCI
jgi:hypothetical protein